MKLVIDIPEEDYIRLRDEGMFGNVTTFKRAVRKGIPLEQEPCEDAISRQAVLMQLDKYLCGVPFEEKGIDKVIKELPPVKPTEKVGHWIDHQDDRWIYAKCSECGTVHDTRTNYCPHCGAKMQEVEE